MTGTAWFTLSYDGNFMGTGNGYSVVETVALAPPADGASFFLARQGA